MPPEAWEVGWVQAISRLHNLTIYGRYGMTMWEVPKLERGTIFCRTFLQYLASWTNTGKIIQSRMK